MPKMIRKGTPSRALREYRFECTSPSGGCGCVFSATENEVVVVESRPSRVVVKHACMSCGKDLFKDGGDFIATRETKRGM